MEAITEFLEDFDFAKILPEITALLSSLRLWLSLLMLAGPVLVLTLGLWYYFFPVSKPSQRIGFRLQRTLVSQAAWQYCQRLVGKLWMFGGAGLTVISLVVLLIFLGASHTTLAIAALISVGIQALLVLASYIFVVVHIYTKFDKNGVRK